MEISGKSLRAVIGENVRLLREAAGLTQDDISRAVRSRGLMWSRSKIAALERGEKAVGVEDLVLLAAALGAVVGEPLPLSKLLEGEGPVLFTDSMSLKRSALRRFLSGDEVVIRVRDSPQFEQRMSKAMADLSANMQRQTRLLGDSDVTSEVFEAISEKSGEAEARVAKTLGLTVGDLNVVAARLWGRSLTDERDARVGTTGNQDSLRAKRGRATRDLMHEIKEIVETAGVEDGEHPEKG